MIKKVLEMIAFSLLTFTLIIGVSYILADRETTFSAVYSEPENSVDVMIVGSSHVNSGYIPSLLWENNNMSAVNAFSWSQPLWVSYHYIIEGLKRQSPEYIVLEMYGIVYGHSYIMPQEIDKTSYNNSFNLLPSLNRWNLIKTSEFCGLDLRNARDFLYISRYHTRWKTFDWSYLSYNPFKQHDYLKGYGYLTQSAGLEQPNVPISEEELVPYEYCVTYLDKIVNLCEEKGIKLIFTMTPYIYGSEETGVIKWLKRYSEEKNIPFFNYLYGEDCRRIGFDYSTDLADNGHCNYYGAYKITRDLCDYLRQQGAGPQSKEEHEFCDMLNEDYSKFERVPAINEITVHTGLDEWLKAASEDEDVTLIVSTYGADDTILQRVNSALSNRGVEINSSGRYILPFSGGKQADYINDFEMFSNAGKISFAEDSAQIYLNGTAVPGEEVSVLKVILYDNILQRPVVSLWMTGDEMQTKEFTSDIIDNYK